MSYPNQKILTVCRRPQSHKDFTTLNNSVMRYVIRDLSTSALAVYWELVSNKDGFRYEFSPAAFEKRGIMPESSARRGRQELEKKGYIVGNNFYEEPPRVREMRRQMEDEAAENKVSLADYDIADS